MLDIRPSLVYNSITSVAIRPPQPTVGGTHGY